VAEKDISHLRVLIANERRDRLDLLAQVVAGLGHEVIARSIDVGEVGAVAAREHPDVALVGLGLSSEHTGCGSGGSSRWLSTIDAATSTRPCATASCARAPWWRT
jgi:hypothetical protein